MCWRTSAASTRVSCRLTPAVLIEYDWPEASVAEAASHSESCACACSRVIPAIGSDPCAQYAPAPIDLALSHRLRRASIRVWLNLGGLPYRLLKPSKVLVLPAYPPSHRGEAAGIVGAVEHLVAPTLDHHPLALHPPTVGAAHQRFRSELLDLLISDIVRQMHGARQRPRTVASIEAELGDQLLLAERDADLERLETALDLVA